MVFRRCRNCGRYLISTELLEGAYCCRDCAETYRACANCGNYFPSDMGYGERYCSPDCAVQYKLSRFADAAATNGLVKELA